MRGLGTNCVPDDTLIRTGYVCLTLLADKRCDCEVIPINYSCLVQNVDSRTVNWFVNHDISRTPPSDVLHYVINNDAILFCIKVLSLHSTRIIVIYSPVVSSQQS